MLIQVATLRDRAQAHLVESARATERAADACIDQIVAAAELITAAYRTGGKLLLFGNGGSAADCQHVATELVGRLSRDLIRPGLPAIALTTDSSFLTAYANDEGFQEVFARQVQALGRPGDVALGISTSGESPNVVRGLEAARLGGLATIALTGPRGLVAERVDVAILVPSEQTQHVQEAHLAIEHVLCDLVERALFDPSFEAG
jgi:D-sedoheptulose 7-phosphate isomerase